MESQVNTTVSACSVNIVLKSLIDDKEDYAYYDAVVTFSLLAATSFAENDYLQANLI